MLIRRCVTGQKAWWYGLKSVTLTVVILLLCTISTFAISVLTLHRKRTATDVGLSLCLAGFDTCMVALARKGNMNSGAHSLASQLERSVCPVFLWGNMLYLKKLHP